MSEGKKKSSWATLKEVIEYLRYPIHDPQNNPKGGSYHDGDLAYMQSLSAAAIQHTPRFSFWVIGVIVLGFILVTLWMSWAELDIVVRAQGKVIPASQVQKIQSLEGGVISAILVNEGDDVSIGQPLMKISDILFLSSYEENSIKYLELKARIVRLTAEANSAPFGSDAEVKQKNPAQLISEERLYQSNQAELGQTLKILQEQIIQAKNKLLETKSHEKQLSRSLLLLKQELKIKRPLVDRQILSEVDYLQLQGKEAEAIGELDGLRLSIPRIQSLLDESLSKLEHTSLGFRNSARKELNEVVAEVSRIHEAQTSLADRVARTTLRSPVKGTVKRILFNTVGGVIKSGFDVMEIVPRDDALLIEAQVKPADVANVAIGQSARIKFTAYDFAIYGSVKGEVIFLSADTITNEGGISYYTARLRPEKVYLGMQEDLRYIKVGMTTEVGIITGKKTILNHLLKPVNRALDNALRER